jgi:hypothetical protein
VNPGLAARNHPTYASFCNYLFKIGGPEEVGENLGAGLRPCGRCEFERLKVRRAGAKPCGFHNILKGFLEISQDSSKRRHERF